LISETYIHFPATGGKISGQYKEQNYNTKKISKEKNEADELRD